MRVFKKDSFVLDDTPFDLQSLKPYPHLSEAVKQFLLSKIKEIRIVNRSAKTKRGGRK